MEKISIKNKCVHSTVLIKRKPQLCFFLKTFSSLENVNVLLGGVYKFWIILRFATLTTLKATNSTRCYTNMCWVLGYLKGCLQVSFCHRMSKYTSNEQRLRDYVDLSHCSMDLEGQGGHILFFMVHENLKN